VHQLARRVLTTAAAATLATVALQAAPAHAVIPPPELFMQVVAHEDDDLFFMNPDLDKTILAGVPAVTVFMTAGEITGTGSTPEVRARNRQKGAQNAYATMAGAADGDDTTQHEWDATGLSIGGKTVEQYTLRGHTIQLLFLDLPDGQLDDLYNNTPQDTVIPSEQTNVSVSQQYSRADALAVLGGIMSTYQPTVLRAQDAEPDRRNDPTKPDFHAIDHDDHIAAANFAREAAAGYPSPLYEVNYRDYNIRNAPVNLDAYDSARKKAILQQYARYDGDVATNLNNSNSQESQWASRMYYRWSRGTQWAARNLDGRAQAFVVRNGRAYTYAQTATGTWNDPQQLADPAGRLAPGIAVGTNPDGRLEIFAHRLSDHHIVALRQATANGSFVTGWDDLGNPNLAYGNADNVGTPAVAANADGRLQVFIKNGGGGISTRYRTTAGTWSSTWVDMGGVDLEDGLAAVTNPAGSIELFGSTRQKILHWYQPSPNVGLIADNAFPSGIPASPPSAALNQEGAIDVLYRQPSTENLMVVWQTAPAGGWDPTPVNIGTDGIGQPAMVTAPPGPDARIMLFARNGDTGVNTTCQTAPNNGYGTWTNLGGVTLDHPAATLGAQDKAVVFIIGTDGVYASSQVATGGGQPFGTWQTLGM
jgi:LmbE family N-acetylglucosaminyl deacetylase